MKGRTEDLRELCGRAVLTIATGNHIYFELAVNLARSFFYWRHAHDISFHLVTDSKVELPPDLCEVKVIRVAPGSLGKGFAPKLHLDDLAPARRTLFVDADCLCVGDLSIIFDRFHGRAVSVIGGTITQGEWFGDVARICAHFGVAQLPKFNGGIYYVEPGPKAAAVYARARDLASGYDSLGLVRLRGQPNDELLMAIAMALEDCSAIQDDGSILGDPQACPYGLVIDVLRGRCSMSNPPPAHPLHRNWYPVGEVHPLIVHLLGHFNTIWQYRAEAAKLKLVQRYRVPPGVANIAVDWAYQRPSKWLDGVRTMLRPTFHSLFGPRKVKSSNRF